MPLNIYIQSQFGRTKHICVETMRMFWDWDWVNVYIFIDICMLGFTLVGFCVAAADDELFESFEILQTIQKQN